MKESNPAGGDCAAGKSADQPTKWDECSLFGLFDFGPDKEEPMMREVGNSKLRVELGQFGQSGLLYTHGSR